MLVGSEDGRSRDEFELGEKFEGGVRGNSQGGGKTALEGAAEVAMELV